MRDRSGPLPSDLPANDAAARQPLIEQGLAHLRGKREAGMLSPEETFLLRRMEAYDEALLDGAALQDRLDRLLAEIDRDERGQAGRLQ
ncbi:MAG: hypothetical protein Q8S58_11610 [Bosea sp. (in: a-proteobacteria)]|uniref:hypothetical protein n=1 Tax=Bosea sp. (in: a-proteobacteria) TaxID=1871050 RepID=UPI0027377A90|nr:hypothetical protein [Bosea sp. (in: a-proteobacteria)]MDP3255253.1 hypothetical protein [Bosea sp. (in: a-proteobacteria)]MDP3319765.1 hypothetical protein [Bosea sp. (in: a-proteobacteria)]